MAKLAIRRQPSGLSAPGAGLRRGRGCILGHGHQDEPHPRCFRAAVHVGRHCTRAGLVELAVGELPPRRSVVPHTALESGEGAHGRRVDKEQGDLEAVERRRFHEPARSDIDHHAGGEGNENCGQADSVVGTKR